MYAYIARSTTNQVADNIFAKYRFDAQNEVEKIEAENERKRLDLQIIQAHVQAEREKYNLLLMQEQFVFHFLVFMITILQFFRERKRARKEKKKAKKAMKKSSRDEDSSSSDDED